MRHMYASAVITACIAHPVRSGRTPNPWGGGQLETGSSAPGQRLVLEIIGSQTRVQLAVVSVTVIEK